jgi:anti-sigma-K factor RskA
MNYNNPQLISALAAQYVLGTLRGKARDRFETLKFANDKIQQEVDFWEAQLHPLSFTLDPVTPEKHVWQRIQTRIGRRTKGNTDDQVSTANVVSLADKIDTVNVRKWKWVSGLAVAACFVLAILLVPNQLSQVDQLQSVAVINNEANKTLWSFDILQTQIAVKTTTFVPKMPNNDYQLWIVPASGDAPISIGVMAQSGEFTLDKPEIFDNIEIAALAVSKEPKGGSPTGLPTVVLYAAEIAQL